MEPSPIEKLLASWKNSTLGTVVQDQESQVQARNFAIWPLQRVRNHFETGNSDQKIVCPCLSPLRLSAFSLELNHQRQNGEELKRLTAKDPDFLGRLVLGQKSAWLLNLSCKFETYVELQQGDVLLSSSRKINGSRAGNRRAKRPRGGHWSRPQLVSLTAGDKMILPPGFIFSLFFNEDSLLTTGNIVPPSQRPQKIPNRLCSVCQNIPFDKLEFEEGPGYPHQPSIEDLLASGETCGLCDLIFQAILKIEKDHEKTDYPILKDLITKMENEPADLLTTVNDPGKGRFATRQQLTQENGVYIGVVALRSPLSHKFVETSEEPQKDVATSCSSPVLSKYEPRPWLYGNYWTLARTPECPPQLIGLGVRMSRGPELEISTGSQTITRFLFRGSEIRLLVEAKSPLRSTVPGRILCQRRSNEVPAIDLIKSWIVNCYKIHNCVSSETDLPTRVLDLSEVLKLEKVKLLPSAKMRGQYIALSHCWGTSQPLRSTSDTLLRHQSGIPILSLPQTFQDAVILSLELGICYLWIDSLCIIQDDPADWKVEADRMSQVYANAWLTIAASSSTGSQSGCFTCAQPPPAYISPDSRSTGMNELRFPTVQIPFSIKGSPATSLYASMQWMPPSFRRYPSTYQIGSFGGYVDPVEDEPLSQRGWTLQERFLSPRIVHFASDQVYFQCGGDVVAEDGGRFENVMSKWRVLDCHRGFQVAKGAIKSITNVEELSRCSGGWNFLVESYSRRQLSVDTDKLPAIAGMARWLQKETGETYLAGLWKEHIYQDLLWRRYPFEEELPSWATTSNRRQVGPQKPLLAFKKPSTYRAPSWSWASLDGSIKFEALSCQTYAHFCDVHLEYCSDSIFSQVQSGWLKIKAPLLEVQLSRTRSEIPPAIAVEIMLHDRAYQGRAIFDFEPDLPCVAAFICQSNALLLEKVEHGVDNFRRVGLVQLSRVEGLAVSLYENDEVLACALEDPTLLTII